MATHNWLNDTARELNGRIYDRHQQGPSLATISKWHQEFLAQGIDHQMTFGEYRKKKMKEWFSQRQHRLNIQGINKKRSKKSKK